MLKYENIKYIFELSVSVKTEPVHTRSNDSIPKSPWTTSRLRAFLFPKTNLKIGHKTPSLSIPKLVTGFFAQDFSSEKMYVVNYTEKSLGIVPLCITKNPGVNRKKHTDKLVTTTKDLFLWLRKVGRRSGVTENTFLVEDEIVQLRETTF